jgi:hypothetical protein
MGGMLVIAMGVYTMFALSEAGLQRNYTGPKPHVSAAPHVGLTMFNLFEVVLTHQPEKRRTVFIL